MSGHGDEHDVRQEIRKYMWVFGGLLVGTVVTLLAYLIHFENMAYTIALALFIATVKAFLVAGWFMHLISERKMIYAILAATVFFAAGLMYLTLWSMEPRHLVGDHIHYVP